MSRSGWMCVLLLCLFAMPVWAEQNPIPWSAIEGAKELQGTQKATAEAVLKKAECYAGCSDTILTCLNEEPSLHTPRRLAAYVVRRAILGKSEADILREIEQRAASAYPPKTQQIDVTGLLPSGDPKAAVKVVVYADFECPYCNVAAPALRRISQEKTGLITYYYKNFPVKQHKSALVSAQALLAAEKQGKFWPMYDLLYESDDLSQEVLNQCASKLGLDLERFKKDMKSKDVLDRIRKEKMEGLALGVIGTPGIFINGKFYHGIKTETELRDRIEEEKDIVNGVE